MATLHDHPRERGVAPASGLTITQCAAQLGLTAAQLKYCIRQGVPTILRGCKGRGSATLLDPNAVLAWMNARGKTAPDQNRKLARALIESIATAMSQQWRLESGPSKLQLVQSTIANFMAAAATIRRELGLPHMEPDEIPESIRQMAKVLSIFR